jgi:hypothetical protein
MPRLRTSSTTAEQLKERIRRLFAHSPLLSFAPLIEETITSVAGTTDPTGKRGMESLVRLVDYYERLFANGFGPRFHLDAWLSHDICAQWSTPARNLPPQIVPIYGNRWAYSLLPSPWDAIKPISIYTVCFPGRPEISDLNLLDYPWLFHELGHHLLSRAGAGFATSFSRHVGGFVRTVRRKAVADSPNLRPRSSDTAAKVRQLWTPRSNTCDWAHELAADTIAVWTCGPAFLAAMRHVVEHENIRPQEISESHPPYELRLRMLLDLAENLEWGSHCSELKATLNQWQTGNETFEANEYFAVAESSLAEECCSQIIRACRAWDLPQCTPDSIREIRRKAEAGEDLDSAIGLVLAAWCIHQATPSASQSWESEALARLAKQLDGDA